MPSLVAEIDFEAACPACGRDTPWLNRLWVESPPEHPLDSLYSTTLDVNCECEGQYD